MSKITKYFNQALFEADMPAEPMVSDEEAFNNALDPNTDPAAFNTDPGVPGYQDKYIKKAKQWMAKISEFADWLNGTEDSLNKYFVEIDKADTAFEGISSKSEMLTRIAGDLADLEQIIGGYVIRSNKQPDIKEAVGVEEKSRHGNYGYPDDPDDDEEIDGDYDDDEDPLDRAARRRRMQDNSFRQRHGKNPDGSYIGRRRY